jgi:uncharacterized OB-fold protein
MAGMYSTQEALVQDVELIQLEYQRAIARRGEACTHCGSKRKPKDENCRNCGAP